MLFGNKNYPTFDFRQTCNVKNVLIVLGSDDCTPVPHANGTEGRSPSCHGDLISSGENSDENFDCRISMVPKKHIKFHFSFFTGLLN